MIDKDESIVKLLAALDWEQRGWMILDNWDADLVAVGLARPSEPRRRVYISTFNKSKGKYYYDCDEPVGPLETDSIVTERGEDVTYEELLTALLKHLGGIPSDLSRELSMKYRFLNVDTTSQTVGRYSQAVEVTSSTRRLYISGQIPLTRDGVVPKTFADQAQLAWANVVAQLKAAGMMIENLVKVTIFLSDRQYALENSQARQNALGGHTPALTVIITGIFDEAWLLEIEAIAEA